MLSKRQLDPEIALLLEQTRAGDSQAFTRLVEKLEPFVQQSSLKICRDPHTADENAQDTFINVFRKLHQFEGNSQFSTWLYSIIVNNCRMKHRRSKLDMASVPLDSDDRPGLADELPSHLPEPERQLLDEELRRVLGGAIEKLPEEYRDVFVLRDMEQLSNQETADALGLSVATVKSRLHRARAAIRSHVAEYVAGD
jgi:RNA polymerase sigma-70 factor (ECF subfamily)